MSCRGEYSPQGEIGHYSQRLEHEWRCENSLHIQRKVGAMEWTRHGNMNWGLVKGWDSHLCLCMPWLRVIVFSFLSACLFSVHRHLFKNKEDQKLEYITEMQKLSFHIPLLLLIICVTLDMSPSFVVLLITEYIYWRFVEWANEYNYIILKVGFEEFEIELHKRPSTMPDIYSLSGRHSLGIFRWEGLDV